ncbi:MAG: hypothetical protein KJZ92_17815, partial [Rhodocyclaceae bacterium]|nr:hypothetical protein [Rhodocyclaceae bacterium]
EHMQSCLSAEDANATWVRDAIQRHGDELSGAAVERVMDLRFGEKRVAFDPSDPEANHRAVAEGYQLVYGAQMSKQEWDAVRRAGAIIPAGQVTPSPKPYSDDPNADPLRVVPEAKWTPAIRAVADYAMRIGERLLGCPVRVTIASDVTWPFAATYGTGRLTFNLGKLGYAWFERGDMAEINDLLLHEYAHHFSGNHLDAAYHDAISRLGGKLVNLALDEPELFAININSGERDAA